MQTARMLALGIAVFYLDMLVAPHLTVWRATPCLFLAWVICAGISLPHPSLLLQAFFFGLACALTLPLSLGMNAITLLVLAALVHRHHHTWNKSNLLTVVLAVFLLTCAREVLLLLFLAITGHAARLTVLHYTAGLLWLTFSGTAGLYFLLLLDRIRIHVEL